MASEGLAARRRGVRTAPGVAERATGATVLPFPQRRPHPTAAVSRPVLAGTPPLRLTRRGRLVVQSIVGLLLLGAIVAGTVIGGSAVAGSDPQQVPVTYHVVLPGETLWQIAGQVAPAADRRDTLARIVELNALPSGAVRVGQRLAIPTDLP